MNDDQEYFDKWYDKVCLSVWQTYTKNGLEGDEQESVKAVRDAVTNCYTYKIHIHVWIKRSLARLGINKE